MPFARLVIRNLANIHGGPEAGTSYDMRGACSRCGTGAIQSGSLHLRHSRFPKRDLWSTLDDEVLVSGRVAEAVASVAPQCLGDVVHAPSGHLLPFKQLRPQETLPRFSAATGVVRERPCHMCDRDGYFGIPHVPIELRYASAPSPELLLAATWECFGNSRLRQPFSESVFAAPLLIASPTLVEALAAASPRGLEFQRLAAFDVSPNPSLQRTPPG